MDLMSLKDISPDQVVFWQWGPINVNATLVFTWIVTGLMVGGAWLVTRRIRSDTRIPKWQNLLEVVVDGMRRQIRDISQEDKPSYLYVVGTLFLFILVSNLLTIIPGYVAPTASLSTTAALAICVFVAVPVYGILDRGFLGYLRQYIRPTIFMLPFNVMGEVSRTLALAVRLFGNIMSGMKIVAILLAIAPFIFPVVMHALGLLTGVIQAYIFAVLAMVYIASATRVRKARKGEEEQQNSEEENPNG
ncbi:MAG: F0F1 ATP synthase subunit A [Desulfatiglandaceae bacterium]